MRRLSLPGTGFRIDDKALRGPNNFHLIRLGAALLVLFAHSFHLLQRAGDEPIGRWFIWLDASMLGVITFFFVSGFLIARSWDTRRSLREFLAARALRILPALWVVILVCVFWVGPMVTTLPLAGYFGERDTWRYLILNALLLTYYKLPGVFQSNPVPGINGALWTIPLEVVMYIILGALGWLGLFLPDAAGGRRHARAAARPFHATLLVLIA
ncbi:MAG: acyltransferase family protein, partial [Betaproteobacteria bacterium]